MSVNDSADVIAALELGMQACTAYERPDLADRLDKIRVQVSDPNVQVVVVGEFKQGKSSLINALVNAKICPVDDDIATAVPTVIRNGEERQAWALLAPAGQPDAETTRRQIPFEHVPSYATEIGAGDPTVTVKGVEVELPRKLLAQGVALVDTPGVGGLGSAHATAALGALSVADAALFVSDASQEYTRAEIDFLAQANDLCPHVVCVMTKTDFYPAWRRVKEINEGHLRRAGFDTTILPVSSMLRAEAVRRNDRDLNTDSGFPQLVHRLTSDVVGGAATRDRLRAHQDLLSVCEQLRSQFEAELAAINDPEGAAALVKRLEHAKSQSAKLRSQVAAWSTTLNDGVADLSSDIDFDFRQRIRLVAQEGEAAIENSDPLDTWAEFEPWLVSRASHEVVSNYRYLTERAADLSAEVAGHFELDGKELLGQLEIHNPTDVLERVTVDPSVDLTDATSGKKGLTVLRGSYSGILMFSMLGTFTGIGLLALVPGVPFGLILGRSGLKDEKKRQLAQRRAQAKMSMKRYCDDVQFQVGKDSRDTLRRIQRQLRDHYGSRADELHRSTSEALKAATDAATIGEAERKKRKLDIEAELKRIAMLRDRANELATPTAPTDVGAPA